MLSTISTRCSSSRLIWPALALAWAAIGCSRTGLFRSTPEDVGVDVARDVEVADEPVFFPDIVPDIVPEVDIEPDGDEPQDADVSPDSDADAGPPECPDEIVPTGCQPELASESPGLCDGFDNDCDGVIDEGCACSIGDVQSCFRGPPGRVDIGACRRGTQRCATDETGVPAWGRCAGSIEPRTETCDGLDNDCDGCVDERLDCRNEGLCPSPDDPRVSEGSPLSPYRLDGRDFYFGEALSWRWRVQGGICDELGSSLPSFTLDGASTQVATFTPRLSGAYRVTLAVETPDGPFQCSWVIDVGGPGLRVEMCYPESSTQDLDLYMMRTETAGPWYLERVGGPGSPSFTVNPDSCGWHNCEAQIRGDGPRADWGYESSPVEACLGGPQGDQWEALGFCANPRLDIDNNLREGTGLPENINVDQPRDGDRFRVMVQNWSGLPAHPVVNVYCAGRLVSTFGAAPDRLEGFEMVGIQSDPNAMWRAADIEVRVDDAGETIGCAVSLPPRPDGEPGYDVTFNDPRF